MEDEAARGDIEGSRHPPYYEVGSRL